MPGGPKPEVQRPRLSLMQAVEGALAGMSRGSADREGLRAGARIGRGSAAACGRSLSPMAAGPSALSGADAAARPAAAARAFACFRRLFRSGQSP